MDREVSATPSPSPQSKATRSPWSAPRLVNLGTVENLTNKMDVAGRNDGGSFTMKRT